MHAGRLFRTSMVTHASATIGVAQTEEPCPDHPLDQSKSDQTLAGLLAHGSLLDIRPSRIVADVAADPVAAPCEEDALYVSLAAYSCRDSLGLGEIASLTVFPFKPLSGHQRDHCLCRR